MESFGKLNKHNIINDPIYGFIEIPNDFIFELIEHPWFQRLRNIRQLGMSHYVYPGAIHTRFHHALGALHLMHLALQNLKDKGIKISRNEEEAALAAILLHDIGHGPFSHALEHSLVQSFSHEAIGKCFLAELNRQYKGRLNLAIKIFENKYHRPFFHQLVSSQLDMDRLDYLMRDSFFTGVNEGIISTDRIIKMLNVSNNRLVVEHKGIYSVEKFLIARRLMYWQVYLHKTVLSAELILIHLLKRAKEIYLKDRNLFTTPALHPFLDKNFTHKDFQRSETLNLFASLDDNDIYASVKAWQQHPDTILSFLSRRLVERKLFRVIMQNKKFSEHVVNNKRAGVRRFLEKNKIKTSYLDYFIYKGNVNNRAYNSYKSSIHVLLKDGSVQDVALASDLMNLRTLNKVVSKHYISYPKECDE